METVQFISITPEKLQNAIIEGLKIQIENLILLSQQKEQNEYLTRMDVAELFQIDVSSVHNWTKKGILQSYQIGGRVYYKRTEVENSIIKLKK